MNSMRLRGETAIITGGGTGIGRGIAEACANEGANVVLAGRRLSLVAEVAELINENGGSAVAVQADVAIEEDVQRLVTRAITEYRTVTIAVNNAGIGGSGPIHEHDPAVWDRVMAVNLKGPFLVARYVLPTMRAQNKGHFINISSESGLEYYPGNGAYGVSKHALNALGEYIQRENQDYGIRVDTICPGMVVTPMSDGSEGLNQDKCLYPEDISDLVIWLLTRRPNIKIGRPVLIQTMENPWES